MKTQKTVLVLGAGASRGFGLPLGQQLKDMISNDLDINFDDFGKNLKSGSYEIVDTYRQFDHYRKNEVVLGLNQYRHASIRISKAMSISGSIDEYVERHRDDQLISICAKIAIVKAILESERRSTLNINNYTEIPSIIGKNANSWLAMMLRDITRGLGPNQLINAFENITIVNFNYDRCFEFFTYHWFQQMYEIDDNMCAEIFNSIKVYHPYGKLASLPFENKDGAIEFGGEISARRLAFMSENIQTYSESKRDLGTINKIKYATGEAKRLVFLGFGFHEQNMKIISPEEHTSRATLRCFATTKGVSKPRIEIDKWRIQTSFNVQAPNGLFFESVANDCEGFWTEYGENVCV